MSDTSLPIRSELLPPGFLDTLVAELDGPHVTGIVLGGSYARGEATPYSDVDIAVFMQDDTPTPLPRKRFVYREGRLVSIGVKTAASVRADMQKPSTAIWVVPGIGDCRVLLDKGGAMSALLNEVRAFRWEPLQEAANSYASFLLMMAAELAHKILGEMLKSDMQAVSYAATKLFSWLTEAVAVQRGVLIKSDNTYYRQVQEAVGADTEWASLHRQVAEGEQTQITGGLVLDLYGETLGLLREVMGPERLEVVEEALHVIKDA